MIRFGQKIKNMFSLEVVVENLEENLVNKNHVVDELKNCNGNVSSHNNCDSSSGIENEDNRDKTAIIKDKIDDLEEKEHSYSCNISG